MATSKKKIPFFVQILMYVGFQMVLMLGMLNKLCFYPKLAGQGYRKKFKGVFNVFEELYFYYIFRRVSDCSHTPVLGSASTHILVNERISLDNGWSYKSTDEPKECINLGSFNYLGLVDTIHEEITRTIDDFGVMTLLGTTALHYELERLTAEFLGMEDAISFSAGFATNALNLPVIISKDSLVLSDEKNHASMIVGLRMSNATVRKFRHNDCEDLERKIKEHLFVNNTSGKPVFSKLFILVEGIYSMDGTIVNLPRIIELKKKYKAYLFIDDAHGVGNLGKHGRGICDYYNIDPQDVDALMGTYSKAFASNGGYICGKKELISYLRNHTYASYGTPMPPATVKKAICSIEVILANEVPNGENRLVRRLRDNAKYLRSKLKEAELNICGDEDSHIIPWILGSVSAVAFSIRELKKRGIAAAGVVYPATPLLGARIRLNVCSAHTKVDLDKVANELKDMSVRYGLNFAY